jgi:putative DNA primase/helicase
LEQLSFDDIDPPCFLVRDDWFMLAGAKRKPGVYCCYETDGTEKKPPAQVVQWICSPLHIVGVSNSEDGRFFGRLLKFKDTLGRWRHWAMPMELLRGSCEELRGELLAAGVLIDSRNRAKLPDYLQYRLPKEIIIAATRTGWSKDGKSFVFHDSIIGDQNIFFQSESLTHDGVAKTGGSYKQWQALAALCCGNPVLIVSVCVSFAGALIAKVHQDSGGIHWLGDSSIGKTTAR